MEHLFEPQYDFSRLNRLELKRMGDVTIEEITYAFENWRSPTYNVPRMPLKYAYAYCIGFSQRSRCFSMFLFIDDNGKYCFTGVKLSNEYEIGLLWCAEG